MRRAHMKPLVCAVVATVATSLVGCSSSSDVREASAAVVVARIEATPWTPWIGLTGFGATGTVNVAIDFTDDGSVDLSTSVSTDSVGNAMVNVSPGTVRYGSRIRAWDSTGDKTLVVAEVRLEKIDAPSNVVSGVGPAGSNLLVSVMQAGPPLATAIVTADPSGNWSYDFSGVYDIEDGRQVSAEVGDNDGDITRATWRAVTPAISAGYSQYGANSLSVKWFAPGTSVRMRVDFGNDGGPIDGFDLDQTAVVDNPFGFMFDLGSFDVLRAGDQIVASGGGWTKELINAPLRIEKGDPVNDVVGGVAGASRSVNVGVSPVGAGGPPVASLVVDSSSGGAWTADFGAIYDIVPDQQVTAAVADADGDENFTTWLARTPWFSAGITNGPPSAVSVSWFASGTLVRVQVDYGNDGSVNYDSTRAVSQIWGESFDLGGQGLLHPGDLVIVTGGGWTKSGVLAAVGIASVNSATDIVSGTAAASTPVRVEISTPPGGPGGPPVATMTVSADAAGTWVASFAGTVDIVTGQQAMASVVDADGDATQVLGWGAEQVWPKTGFERPVQNPPATNSVKSGSVTPIKFSLGGDRGLDVLVAGYPKSSPIECGSNPTTAGDEQVLTSGRTGLSYSATTGLYEIKWSTLKSWKGTCRQLVVFFTDGTSLRANFRFG